MFIDCHNHTNFSVDADFTLQQMLQGAIENHMEVFAITDHCEIDKYQEDKLEISVPGSVNSIEAAKTCLTVKLLTGIEMGQPLSNPQLADLVLNQYPFDYVIGSIHSLDTHGDFYYIDYAALTDSDIHDILWQYYQSLYSLALWNKFDSIAHITYPYRYIFAAKSRRDINIDIAQFDDIAIKIFKAVISNEKAIENNASSFTKSKEDYELNYRYMKLYYDLGGRLVTIGSDAHTPLTVGNGIEEGYGMLKEIGFNEVVYFEKRKPIKVLL